jgi:steroid delta-isomerase-like uncharacterized protein
MDEVDDGELVQQIASAAPGEAKEAETELVRRFGRIQPAGEGRPRGRSDVAKGSKLRTGTRGVQAMGVDVRLERMKALVRAHYDAGVNNQDLTRVDDQLTDDFVDHAMPGGTPRGPAPVKAWLAQLKIAFPDLRVETDDLVAENDRVAVRATWTGTHSAEIFGMPATGRVVTFSGAVFWRIAGDRIAERWAFLDTPSLMRQLQG